MRSTGRLRKAVEQHPARFSLPSTIRSTPAPIFRNGGIGRSLDSEEAPRVTNDDRKDLVCFLFERRRTSSLNSIVGERCRRPERKHVILELHPDWKKTSENSAYMRTER